MNMQPTDEQIDALRQFAHCNGRNWKATLRHCWESGNWDACPSHVEAGYLQQVRNTLGPTWLVRYKLPKFVE